MGQSDGAGSPSKPAMPEIRKFTPDTTGDRVREKVVIITGANSPLGIGRAAAHQFAAHGARGIYLCDYDGSYLEAHKAEMSRLFPAVDVQTCVLDAADEEQVKRVIDDCVARHGRLDVFFANAGISGGLPRFTEISKEEFERVLKTNVLGVWLAAKHSTPAMMLTSASKPVASGCLLATASVAGLRSNAGATHYSASKAAVINLVQTIAFQLAGTGIRANAICPGLIETGMTTLMFERARERGTGHLIGNLNPAKRAGHADEVARVALFLASDDASYVNGQAVPVDGGLSAGLPYIPGKLA